MADKKRKILYISGTRADFGLVKNVLFAIKNNLGMELELVVAGMHLMPEFGKTINEIKKDGFKVHEIKATYEKDNKESMAIFIGKIIQLLPRVIKKINPDIILLLGDRGEMLAGATVGAYLSVPVAHIHGGDVSSTVDDSVRHAITKLSHIHFPATEKSAGRLVKMGEEPHRIFVAGAPGLDGMLNEKLFSKKYIAKKYNLDPFSPVTLVIQHPVTIEAENAGKQMENTMNAVKELGYQTIVIYPNADAGGRKMIKVIEKYRKYPFVKIYKNIPRTHYLSLLKIADVMIGNSSSGIIEAPSFNLPAVNIGTRQSGRERAGNTIEVGYDKNEIKKAIKKAIYDKNFIKKTKKIKSPYGDGKAGDRIAKILSSVKINNKLLEKKLFY